MPDEEFESIDAIEKHFGRQIKQAGDDAEKVRELTIDLKEAKADFREKQSAIRELNAHKREAIAKAGIPEDFHDYVTGDTPEAIDASVAKVKERVEKLTKAQNDDDDAARRLYGEPAHGGGTPPPPRSSDEEKWLADFQARFDDPTAQFSVREVEKYAQILGGHKLLHGLARNSQIFDRHGITPEVVKQFEAGKLPQRKPEKSGVTVAPRG
jgi:hypothetical protein